MHRPSVLCAIALLLVTVHRPVLAAEGDVISSSDFRLGTQGWALAGSGWSSDGLQSEGDLIAAVDSAANPSGTWYYAAPPTFVNGDKTLAYNGFLSFDFGHFEYESMGTGIQKGYDIMIFGKNKKQTLGLKGVFQMDDTKLSKSYNVRLEETFMATNSTAMWELVNVVKPLDGKLVTKAPTQHEFVTTLQQLTGIWIRGSYFQGSEATWLKNVRIVQGVLNKGTPTGREESTLIAGVTVKSAATEPAAATGCCASKTCVSSDMYEIDFDRPGCMQAADMVCCSDAVETSVTGGGSPTCSQYSKNYDRSSAANIIRGTDYNEGRVFMTPGTISPCWGVGPTSASKSACYMKDATLAQASSSPARPAMWDSGTKNQNIGDKGIPINKPFVKDYYMNSLPRICSAATLTVSVHGDIADPLDYIEVYGEDELYLGKLFAGNLTYMYEGQRPYDPNTELWNCDGPYDAFVKGTDVNVRLADPHHPSGAWPKVTGYRGGVDSLPGVYGKEDTRCVNWQKGGDRNPSLEYSETLPFIDSIAIPQEKMMQYSADGQMRLTFRTWRNGALENVFSGTGGGGTTSSCLYSTHANGCGTGVPCTGCDLNGKVLFRSIKLRFSAAACFVKHIATDKQEVFVEGLHKAQPLNVSLDFTVPTGSSGLPGGDGVLSVVVGADIFGLDKFITVYTAGGVKIGDLFRSESSGSLRSKMSDDAMVTTSSFGAVDSPVPFRTTTNCDTVSPITVTDKCTKADNRWSMGSEFVNYTDSVIIPRALIQTLAVNGKISLRLASDVPGNAFSPSSGGHARISPVTLTFPLMHCFMRAIKSGPNFGIYLERPRSYYFTEHGLPLPAGDVTVMFVAHWQRHVRYVTRHVGPGAVTVANAYDGTEDGLPVLRVDKDTVAEMGTVWVYKDQDGHACCPAIYRPDFAGKQFPVPAYSNCLAGGCTDPDLTTTDLCTYEEPCAQNTLVSSAAPANSLQTLGLAVSEPNIDSTYVGMKIILSTKLAATVTAGVTGTGYGCIINQAATGVCRLKGGGGSGYTSCTYTTDGTGAVTLVVLGAVGYGFESAPTILPASTDTCIKFDYTAPLDAAATNVVGAANARTILSYTTARVVTVSDYSGLTLTAANYWYRITAEGISSFSRNTLDGGSSTGTVVVPLSSAAVCQTRYIASGYIEMVSGSVVRLDAASASAADNAYKSYAIDILDFNNAGYVSYTISSFDGTLTGSVTAGTATSVTLDASAVATANYYNKAGNSGLSITIDIDGNADTGDDVWTRTILTYSAGKVVTFATLATDTTAIPTTASTYKIFVREATLSAAPTVNTAPAISSASPATITTTYGGQAVSVTSALSSTTFQVNAADSLVADKYTGHKLVIYHANGDVNEYICVSYTVLGVCTLDRPLVKAATLTVDFYAFFRPYRIYQTLRPTCLVGSNLRVTYTAGNAKAVSNDPGELDTVYSNWDSPSGNMVSVDATGTQTGKPSIRDVRSWVMKLTGDGYYESLYRQQGVGAFATTTLAANLATGGTTLTLTTLQGITVGMFLLLTDESATAPQREVVKVTDIVSTVAGTLTVQRAQLGTSMSVATFTAATPIKVYPFGDNLDGNGMDDMAAFGGTSRATSSVDNAYTGLSITIIGGTGTGQTRVIGAYHGASRTAYLTTRWNVIPDATSRYTIWYSALIAEVVFPGNVIDPTWALVSLPRPVRKGYLWQVEWYDCATAVVNEQGFSGSQNANSLPQCPGSLRTRIPKQGELTDTSVTGSGLNIAQANVFYTMQEMDITRQEYPEMIEQHKLWPHGYSYMKLLAGEDGELLSNVFLKDYTQYSPQSYYTDTVTIPRDRFETYVRQSGDFTFTLQTPPGKGNVELLSVVISYPVTKEADANTYDANTLPTMRIHSHGPPPFFPASRSWTGADEDTRGQAPHPRFQTHTYTSTCGNGIHDGNEYCDDGNEVDGDGCSSSCTLEAGWSCATAQLDAPSYCVQGSQGSRIPDPAVGCKYYACEMPGTAAYSITGRRCSGFPKDAAGNLPICLDVAMQGTCTLCVGWSNSPTETQKDGYAGRTAYRR